MDTATPAHQQSDLHGSPVNSHPEASSSFNRGGIADMPPRLPYFAQKWTPKHAIGALTLATTKYAPSSRAMFQIFLTAHRPPFRDTQPLLQHGALQSTPPFLLLLLWRGPKAAKLEPATSGDFWTFWIACSAACTCPLKLDSNVELRQIICICIYCLAGQSLITQKVSIYCEASWQDLCAPVCSWLYVSMTL